MAIMISMEDVKTLHDELLKQMPSGATHSAESCPFCAGGADSSSHSGGDMSTKTYSQEELDSAVADAVKALEDRIREVEAANEQSEIEARHAQEKSELEASIKELQGQIDSKTLEVEESKAAYEGVLAYLTAVAAEVEEAAELAARRDARLATVREVARFSDEYVEANADRWASLEEAEFEALVSDWKAISSASREEGEESGLPGDAGVEIASRDRKTSSKSAVSEVISLASSGVNFGVL